MTINGTLNEGSRVYTFSSTTPIFSSVPAGTYGIAFEVYGVYGDNEEEKIGYFESSATIVDGMKYTITDNVANPRIDAVDPTTAVSIDSTILPATKIASDTQTLSNSDAVTFTTDNTPTGSNKTTTVVFPAGSITDTSLNDTEATLSVRRKLPDFRQ